MKEAKIVVLCFDEVRVKENLVYDMLTLEI